jgi:hypothetical protein
MRIHYLLNKTKRRNNMKTLNLQAAIAGAPIQTVEGTSVKFIAYVKEAVFDERIIVLAPFGGIILYREDTEELVMTPVFKKYWFNVCAGKSGVPYFGSPFEGEADATQFSNYLDGYIKTISIEVEQ